jgi:hypothetical protein
MMALVTVGTIYQTVYVAMLLLVSKGWVLMRASLSRREATSITMLMGAVYLSYSAYYVSANVSGIKNAIAMIINVLYVALFAIVLKNALTVLHTLKLHFSILQNNEV